MADLGVVRCIPRLKAEVHFNPWTICDRFLEAEVSSPQSATGMAPDGAGQSRADGSTCTNLLKIVRTLDNGLGAEIGEEETQRVLRRFSRMYMTTLAMEIDRIESELRHALPEFKYVHHLHEFIQHLIFKIQPLPRGLADVVFNLTCWLVQVC